MPSEAIGGTTRRRVAKGIDFVIPLQWDFAFCKLSRLGLTHNYCAFINQPLNAWRRRYPCRVKGTIITVPTTSLEPGDIDYVLHGEGQLRDNQLEFEPDFGGLIIRLSKSLLSCAGNID